jgi:hypothetical protein
VRVRVAVGAGEAVGCGGEVGVQRSGIATAWVSGRTQPATQAGRGEPVGLFLGVEAGQESQADGAVQGGEQPDSAGEDVFEVLTQLVGHRDPVSDEVFAGPAGGAQRGGGRGVRGERPQSSAVGAQRVSQHERVEPVVFVAGRTVATAQILQLVRADHHHGAPGLDKRIDDGTVGAFDTDLADAALSQQAQQGPQPSGAVFDHAAVDLTTTGIDDRHGMVVAGPVNSARHVVSRFLRQGGWGRIHHSLLAARPSGEAPAFRGRDVTAASLTDRRSPAHSPVDGRHAPGYRPVSQNSSWTSTRPALAAMTSRHLGCIEAPSRSSDTGIVHQ